MTPIKPKDEPSSGPTLETYVETRFNLLIEFINEKFSAQDVAMRAFVASSEALLHATRAAMDASQLAADIRYQQRFEAQSDALAAAFLAQQTAMKAALDAAEKAVQAALAAQERGTAKSDLATDKRFESVNEFRKTLADQAQTFMPRAETTVLFTSLSTTIRALKEQVDGMIAERIGIKGGWGYAVGVAGFVALLLGLFYSLMK